MRRMVRRVPGLRQLGLLAQRLISPFHNSQSYWEARYAKGGNSGSGSYEHFARFKAEVLNAFTQEMQIASVIELGCGDGNQLGLFNFASYIGFDVSADAIERCQQRFAGDASKQFKLTRDYAGEQADLTLSLDVIYHLVEDAVFDSYMRQLFAAARRFVVVYSSNDEALNTRLQSRHVRHRQFTRWIEEHAPAWRLRQFIANPFPYQPSGEGTFANFYIFEIGSD